jgi:hypothetical protein
MPGGTKGVLVMFFDSQPSGRGKQTFLELCTCFCSNLVYSSKGLVVSAIFPGGGKCRTLRFYISGQVTEIASFPTRLIA